MAQQCGYQIVSEDYADFIIEYDRYAELEKISADICFNSIDSNYSVAYAPITNLPSNLLQRFGYSIFPKCFGLMDIGSQDASGITRVQNIPNLNLRGQGVLVGVIDTGIDYTHPAFRNADGTSKILAIWDQTIQSDTSPDGFFYGTEYTQTQLNYALTTPDPFAVVPSNDENGHGTLLAGITAGNRIEDRNFSGVATDANIIVVKLKPAKKYIRDFFLIPSEAVCYQENDIMLGVKYLIAMAETLLRPLSICIGLGTSQGGHDGRNISSIYLSNVADLTGIGVTIAAGNEGNRGHHYFGTVDPALGYDTVELKVGENTVGFSMELWGNSPNIFSIDILSPTGEYIPRIPARIQETREINFIFEQTKIFVDYNIIESQTGDELILVRFQNPTEGIWRFRIYSSENLATNFNIWLPITNFLTEGTFFTRPNPDTTLTSPGNANLPIIVTAYDYTTQGLFINASRGFTRYNAPNPSFSAPGVNMIGPAPNNNYVTASGTSIAAAHTAGVLALLLEWGIVQGNQTQLDTLIMKNFLIRGAKREPNVTYPSKEWGYGILEVYNAFNILRGGPT